jgi:CDP-diacylglycerol--serine O-phosphatidyltransferase
MPKGHQMPKSRRLRRGIYLLPTLFTVGNLFCGYSSIVQSSAGRLESAALLILLAAILDGLDGRIARLTGTTSEFGIEFDSLADIVSFGIAPALLAYHWGLGPGRIGWSLAFLYVVCAAMRLARYNIGTAATADKRYFVGLPSPMAGSVLACIVFAFPTPPEARWLSAMLAGLVFSVAILMVSRLRYRSFREIDLRNRRSYIYVLPIALILVAVALHPKYVMLALCTAYLVSSPILFLRDRRGSRPAASTLEDGSAAAGGEVVDEPAIR